MRTIENVRWTCSKEFSKTPQVQITVVLTPKKEKFPEKILFFPSWRECNDQNALSLKDIREQVLIAYGDVSILVIVEYPNGGSVYRFNNRDGWVITGNIFGYE